MEHAPPPSHQTGTGNLGLVSWASASLRPHPGLRRLLAAWEPEADLVQHPLPCRSDFPSLGIQTWEGRRPTRAH